MNASPRIVTADHLRELAGDLLTAAEVPAGTARIVSASLVEADLAGHGSHGVRRLVPYLEGIEAGVIVPGARPEVVARRGATAVAPGGAAGRRAVAGGGLPRRYGGRHLMY